MCLTDFFHYRLLQEEAKLKQLTSVNPPGEPKILLFRQVQASIERYCTSLHDLQSRSSLSDVNENLFETRRQQIWAQMGLSHIKVIAIINYQSKIAMIVNK